MRNQTAILSAFDQSQEMSISELLAQTAIPRSTLKRELNRLIDERKIEAVGRGRGRYYRRMATDEGSRVMVFKGGKLAGYLSYEGGRYWFVYERGYRGRELDGLARDETHQAERLFAVFENLIPESDRRDRYLAEGKNLVSILLELDNTHGDFDFAEGGDVADEFADHAPRINWLVAREAILSHHTFPNILTADIWIDPAILHAVGKHSSLSGYQNKIDITLETETHSIIQSPSGADYLLKPYNPANALYDYRNKEQNYLPYLGLNEHLFMSLAKNAYGFDVPWSGIVAGERDFHYVVKRYDRHEGYKYEQRDFAQIMNIPSDQKYYTTSEKLFDAVARVIKSRAERIRVLEFYLFGFVIEHADLHTKNISILHIGRQTYRLSPLYDLIGNGIYHGDSDELALPLGGKRSNLHPEDFYALAERLEISRLQTRRSIRKIVGTFIEAFPDYIEACRQMPHYDHLRTHTSRYTHGSFADDLERFYLRRVASLRERGFVE
jgi:serine/threonine-protein kinase HipA